jgi:hypothetical protein
MANLMKKLTLGNTAYEVCDASARETLENKTSYEDMNAAVKKAAPRNLLDNSDFRNPVNQRGKTIYNSSSMRFTIDRWRAPSALTVEVLDSSVKLTCISETTANGLTQIFENAPAPGSKVTIALKEKDVEAIWVGAVNVPSSSYVNAFKTESGTWGRIYSDRATLMVSAGTPINVEWFAIYEGEYTSETLPEYQPKGYGAELQECQRYYIRIGEESKNTPLGTVVGYSSTGVYLAIPGFHMRDAYTVQMVTDISTLKYTTNTINNGVSATSVAGYNANTGGVIALNINGSFTAGTPYMVWLIKGVIEISADIVPD